MIDDDHVEPGRPRLFERLERLRPAIDADATLAPLGLELDQRFARRTIALHQPVRDIDDWLGTQPAQQQHQQRRAGRPVHVIIAEDRDRLAALDRVGEPLGALVHVLEAAWIGQEVADARVTMARQVFALDPAGQQQLVDQRVHGRDLVGRPAPAPRLPAYRSVDIERSPWLECRPARPPV